MKAVLFTQVCTLLHCVSLARLNISNPLVDDGSATIDCNLRHNVQQELLNRNPLKKQRIIGGTSQIMHTVRQKDLPLKPLAVVGNIVRVAGRVLNRNHSRLINVTELGP